MSDTSKRRICQLCYDVLPDDGCLLCGPCKELKEQVDYLRSIQDAKAPITNMMWFLVADVEAALSDLRARKKIHKPKERQEMSKTRKCTVCGQDENALRGGIHICKDFRDSPYEWVCFECIIEGLDLLRAKKSTAVGIPDRLTLAAMIADLQCRIVALEKKQP